MNMSDRPTKLELQALAATPPVAPGPPARKSSPEAQRQSFIFLLALIAGCLATYAMTQVAGVPRLVLAVVTGGWFAMAADSMRFHSNEPRTR